MSELRLAGKIALVTGAGQGMGRAMALGLIEAGARVALLDVRADLVEAAAGDARALGGGDAAVPLIADITDPAQCLQAVEQTVRTFGTLHALVNNAGRGMAAIREDNLANPIPFWEVDPARWQALVDLNVRAPFLLARAAAPHLIRQGWGRIVNVTTSFDTMYRAAYTPYGQTKAALEAATASWAKDLAQTGVTVNALVPGGAVNTAFFSPTAQLDRQALIQPDVMVAPMRWLLSEASNGVTGQRFVARNWDAALPDAEAARMAGAPAAWPSLGSQSLWPGGKPVQ